MVFNHPYFKPVVFVLVALAAAWFLQQDQNLGQNQIQQKDAKNSVDTANWNSWYHVQPWPDDGAVWPTARLAHASCVIGGDLWVFGGLQGGTTPDTSPAKIFNDLWKYDEFHDRWTEVHFASAVAPSPRLHHTLVASPDGKSLLLFGGFDAFVTNPNHKAIDDGVWIFDIESRIWKQVFDEKEQSSRPPARGAHEAVVIGSDMIVFAGSSKIISGFSNDLWRFSLETHKWTKLGPFPETDNQQEWPAPRMGFPMIKLHDDYAYLFGGATATGQLNDEWLLDVTTDNSKPQWKRLHTTGDVPSPRRAPHADVALKHRIFLFGGMALQAPATGKATGPIPQIFDDFFMLNVLTLKWKKIEKGSFGTHTKPPPTFGHTANRINDKIVMFGGRTTTMASPGSASVWEFFFSPEHPENL